MLAGQKSNIDKINKAFHRKSNLDCKYGNRERTYAQKALGLGSRFLHQVFLWFGASHLFFLNFGVFAYELCLVEPILYTQILSIYKNCDKKYNGKKLL